MSYSIQPISQAGPDGGGERANVERQWLLTGAHRKDWLDIYRRSVNDPSRAPFLAALHRAAPFRTALDLGCNCGVLVPLLEAASPGVRITGVDLVPRAVTAARAAWPQHTWVEASLPDWLPLMAAGRRYDLITSGSTLCAMAPSAIDAVLDAIMRMCRTVVLQEPTVTARLAEGPSPGGIPEWRYDYARRFAARGWTGTLDSWHDAATTRPCAVFTFRAPDSTSDGNHSGGGQ